MLRTFFLKLSGLLFFIGIGIIVAQSVSAAAFTCQFSCIRRVPHNLVCCARAGGCTRPPDRHLGTVVLGIGEAPVVPEGIREWNRSSPDEVAAAGYLVDPVYYSLLERRSVRVESPSIPVCSATECRAACISACGPAASAGEPTGEQTRCLDRSIIPSYVDIDTNACRSIVGGGALALGSLLRDIEGPPPTCSEIDPSADTPVGGAPVTGQTCNPPPIPQNAPAKKCVFYCLQPGTGRTGDGRATLETGETAVTLNGGGQTCYNVNAIRHVGTRACSTQGECACIDECKSTCGSEGGKTKCFLGSGNPDQILACPGAGTIGQARPPVCTQEVVDGSPKTLTNPLRTTDIGELIARFIRALSGIAGSMALLMFVVGGVMWMTAEGSDRVQTAQTILKNSTVGILLIFFAYSIVSLFLSVLGL